MNEKQRLSLDFSRRMDEAIFDQFTPKSPAKIDALSSTQLEKECDSVTFLIKKNAHHMRRLISELGRIQEGKLPLQSTVNPEQAFTSRKLLIEKASNENNNYLFYLALLQPRMKGDEGVK